MKTSIQIALFLFAVHTLLPFSQLNAQVSEHHIIDHVELPAILNQARESDCYISFEEKWTFLSRGTLMKEVISQEISCSRALKDIPLPSGITRIKDLSYEFMLLDPHLVETGNKAFPEPDSMDIPTRKLQAKLIELVQKYMPIHRDYNPAQQMLSVYFHEEWEVDSDAKLIRKKVKAITPVIWQRRQTVEGKAIDDGDSGLPVYYKNPLQRIQLRQP